MAPDAPVLAANAPIWQRRPTKRILDLPFGVTQMIHTCPCLLISLLNHNLALLRVSLFYFGNCAGRVPFYLFFVYVKVTLR